MKFFINEKNLRFKSIDPHKGARKMIFLTLNMGSMFNSGGYD
jgi:hypothetical protein